MKTYAAIYAIPEMIVTLIGVACIGWLLWTVREDKQAVGKEVLDRAWRDVLNDPHYLERRHFEERKRVEDDAHKRAADSLDWRRNRKNVAT